MSDLSHTDDRRVIVALDFPDGASTLEFCRRLDPQNCRVKVGFELFVTSGPALVETLAGLGFEVFLDLKFHDIPNTVAAACRSAASLGVWMMNVHASGGSTMMRAAREAIEGLPHRPLLIAVTVLTSMNDADVAETGITLSASAQAARLAGMAAKAGLDGVVCSAIEAPAMRTQQGGAFILVTPGIRPSGVSTDDQKRVMTPGEAVAAGAGYLVIGRPITKATDPIAVLTAVNAEIAATLAAAERL